jgi:hypothetical protein
MEEFLKLKIKSNNRGLLLNYVKNDKISWVHKNAFDLKIIPFSMLDYQLQIIKRKFDVTPVIFKMDPWKFYRFHVDASRSCAINLLLEGAYSNTYYGCETEDEEVLDIKELKYDLDIYYLINTQIKHSVVNRNNTRYMFSIGFPSSVSYNEVKKFLIENNLA